MELVLIRTNYLPLALTSVKNDKEKENTVVLYTNDKLLLNRWQWFTTGARAR